MKSPKIEAQEQKEEKLSRDQGSPFQMPPSLPGNDCFQRFIQMILRFKARIPLTIC